MPTPTTDLAVDLHEVHKTYRGKGGVTALRGVAMQIHRGEVFGLLGPNGAGKSTLVKILMTVIHASRCRGSVLGQRVGHKPTLAKVGYLPEHHRFPDYLTARQVLEHFAAMSGLNRRDRKRRAAALLEEVGLGEWKNKRVRGFSKGMRQRVGIASALMHDPDLVVLDEPTDGVDPVGRREIREMLVRMRGEGRAVLLNSHLLSELEMVCDRVAILVQGKVHSQGTLDELTAGQRYYELVLDEPADKASAALRKALPSGAFDTPPPPPTTDRETSGPAPSGDEPRSGKISGASAVQATGAEDAEGVAAALARRVNVRGELATGEWIEVERSTLRVGTTDPAVMQPILDRVRASGLTVRTLREAKPTLEDLFISAVTDPVTGKPLRPGAADPTGSRVRRGRPPKHTAQGDVGTTSQPEGA